MTHIIKKGLIKVPTQPKDFDLQATGLVFKSYDNQIALEFNVTQQDGTPADLLGANLRLLMFIYDEVDGTIKKEPIPFITKNLITESFLNGHVVYILPEAMKAYNGMVEAYVYIEYPDGSTSDNLGFTFRMKRSAIDGLVQDKADYFIEDFKQLLAAASLEANEVIEGLDTEIKNLQQTAQDVNAAIDGAMDRIDGLEAEIGQLDPIGTKNVLKVKYTLNSKVEILSRYGELYNLKRSIEPMGINQLWQIGDMYLIEEYNNKLSTFDGGTKLFEQYTDMLSPWGGLAAVDNIDGDNTTVTNEIYTGGWHGYPNANNGTKTARQNSVKIYVDGVLMLNQAFECYAHSVTVVTEHFIQAANTKKEDGTGREVLIEKIAYTFTGNEIDVKLEATPTEPVTLMRYHFLQCQRVWNFHDHFFVIGDSNHRGWLTGDQDIWGGEANTPATAIEIVGPNDQITMEIDPTYDIGDNRFNQNASVWYHRSYGKLYFLPINNPTGLALGTGDRIRAHGKYKLTRLN